MELFMGLTLQAEFALPALPAQVHTVGGSHAAPSCTHFISGVIYKDKAHAAYVFPQL